MITKEEIIEKIKAEIASGVVNDEWIESLSTKEKIFVNKVFLELLKKHPDYKTNEAYKAKVKEMNKTQKQFEKEMLGHDIKIMMSEIEYEASVKAFEESAAVNREILKQNILLMPNSQETKDQIAQLMELEKKNNIFDKDNWEEILHLL